MAKLFDVFLPYSRATYCCSVSHGGTLREWSGPNAIAFKDSDVRAWFLVYRDAPGPKPEKFTTRDALFDHLDMYESVRAAGFDHAAGIAAAPALRERIAMGPLAAGGADAR